MRKLFILAFAFSIAISSFAKKTQEQPNIVVLFVDDLGWADLGYRNPLFDTPNVNKLSEDGMDFERAYVTTPTCSPSRASILTGREPVRFHMVRHIAHEDKITGRNANKYHLWKRDPAQTPSITRLPLEEITYAERLKEYGYHNMFVGKWHLGEEEYHPIHQGFDEQHCTGNHGHPSSYYEPYFNHASPFAEGESHDGKFLTDVLTDKAVDLIKTYKKKQPFMLNLWYYDVHGPHIGKKELIEKYKAKGMEKRFANYGAMVEAMDQSVGRVRAALEEKGIADNTVILFTSDQGGFFTNYPLRGKKNGGNTLGEGGARVPFIIYYPGLTKPVKCEVPIQTLDVYSTLVEIASGKDQKDSQVNGVSLMPLLRGEEVKDRDLFFYRSYEDQYAAIISGDWKLIKYRTGACQLYNLKEDVSEVSDLIFVNPSVAKVLKAKLQAWEDEAVPKNPKIVF